MSDSRVCTATSLISTRKTLVSMSTVKRRLQDAGLLGKRLLPDQYDGCMVPWCSYIS